MYEWGHGCVSLCLAYFTSITSSRFIHVVTNDKLSFLWPNNIPLYVHVCVYSLHFLYPFSHLSMMPGLCPYLAYVKNVAVNVGLHTSLQDSGFISFRYIPNSGLLDYMVVLFLILWGNIHTIFHNGYTNLCSHQQCISVPFTAYPCSYLSSFVILVMISDVKHLFMFPLVICESSLKKCLFGTSAHF